MRYFSMLAGGIPCLLVLVLFPFTAFPADRPLNVTVSILPEKYFVEKIGGENVTVSVMVPVGADLHVYEPRPRQIIELSKAKLYFSIGVPFENAWLPRFKSANPKLVFVPIDRGVPKIAMTADSHDHDGEKGGLDPHIWLSPPLVKAISANIKDALTAADPSHADDYRANHARFLKEI